MPDIHTAQNISQGSQTRPLRRVSPLWYSIMNARVGRQPIGSRAWWNEIWSSLDRINYPELEYLFGDEHPRWLRRAGETRFHLLNSMRIERAMAKLETSPTENVSFVTVVTDIATSKEDALRLAKVTGNQLSSFIRRRFKDAVWLMFPEVDVKLAGNIKTNLIVHRNWRTNVVDDRLVYKVHFHGVLYTPGLDKDQVEHAFRFGRSGKRSKKFFGSNQVRVLAMREGLDGSPDVCGVCGYATKCFFKPPVMSRMLEGAGEWIWLTDKIMGDSSLVKIGGVCGRHKRGEDEACQHSDTRLQGNAEASSDNELEAFLGIDDAVRNDGETEQDSSTIRIIESRLVINSETASLSKDEMNFPNLKVLGTSPDHRSFENWSGRSRRIRDRCGRA